MKRTRECNVLFPLELRSCAVLEHTAVAIISFAAAVAQGGRVWLPAAKHALAHKDI